MDLEEKNKKNKNCLENLLALVLLFSLSVSFGFLFKLYFLTGEDASAQTGTALRFDAPPVDTSSSKARAPQEENLQPERRRQTQPNKGRTFTKAAVKKNLEDADKLNEAKAKEGENLSRAVADKSQGENSFSDEDKLQKNTNIEKETKKKNKTIYVFNSAALFPKKLGGVHAQWERVANIQKKKARSFCRVLKVECLMA